MKTSITNGQMKQIRRFLEDVLEKVAIEQLVHELGLDNPGAQRVIEHGDEFAEAVRMASLASLKDLSVSDKFKNEEVASEYGYFSGYKPKGLNEQCNQLRILFSGIGFCNQDLLAQIEKGGIELPKHAEEWFAIPNWMKNPKIFGVTYSEALGKVLTTITHARDGKFYNFREGQIDEKRLRQSARTQKFFADLSKAQGDPDILIVAAQFGIRHRGRSARRAREVFLGNEFGLGAFAVGIMLLTHPERLMNYDDLWIDCAGDEFDEAITAVRFDRAPCFCFYGGGVGFGTCWSDGAIDDYGSASAFGPQ